MAYTRIDWKNGEAGNTPLNANNLNRMDEAIAELDERAGDSEYNFDSLEARVTQAETNLNGKMNENNPVGNGILTIDAINTQALTSMDVDTNDLEVSRISGKNGVIIATDDITVDGIPTPIGSLANTANTRSQEAETRANSAYNRASDAIGDAVIAMNRANENKAKIDLHTGLIGEGVGDKEPILGYTDGYYIAPNGSVTQYNATAKLIMIDFLDFLYSGDNIIFNHVDLLPTENCIPCAWYDVSGNFISAADGLNVIAEIDEQTFKITKQYIDYCIIPVPAGASSCKLSGLANGIADIRIQTSLSEAIKDLQSKPTPSSLALTGQRRLTTSDAGKILSLDVMGKSWQTKNLFSSSGYTSEKRLSADEGQTYGSNLDFVDVDASTMYVSALIEVTGNGTYTRFSYAENYLYRTAFYNASKVRIGKTESKTFTVPSDCKYVAMCGYISELQVTTLYGVPTPASEIPIVNASGVIKAIGKNLFDPENVFNGHTNDATINANNAARLVYAKCEPGQTYTVSKKSGQRFQVAYTSEAPALGVSYYGKINNPTASAITITAGDNAKYVVAFVWLATADTTITAEDMLATVQIEAGTTATAYEPYASNQIDLSAYDLRSVEDIADRLIVYPDKTGKLIKRVISAVYDGSEADWKQTATDRTFYLEGPNNKMGDIVYPTNSNNAGVAMCSHFTNHARNGIAVGQFALTSGFNTMFYHSSQTINEWKTWLAANNITIYAVLKTPIETNLSAEQVAEILALETYAPETIIETELDVQSVGYTGDVKGYIDSKFEYSYTVRKIGKWADGKDFYQAVIKTTTPSALNSSVAVCDLIKSTTHSVKRLEGMIDASPYQDAINMYLSGSYHIATFIQREGIMMNVSVDLYANKPCEIIVEYTLKDSAPATASVLSLDEETEE